MTELEKLCEQALYEEIQDLGDGKAIVRDVPTGRLLRSLSRAERWRKYWIRKRKLFLFRKGSVF